MSKDSKKTGTEVAVKTNYGVSANLADELKGMGLGAGENIDTNDILIPKLQLTQALSKAVANPDINIQQGVYMNSVNNEDLGKSNDVIVMDSYKNWQVFKVSDKGQDEYLETIPFDGNEQLEYDYENEKGEACKRIQVLGFYVLLLDEIKAGMAFPYAVDFKKGSKKAGRELSTYFAKLRSNNLPSFAKVFSIGSELVQDEYTYHRKTVSMGRDITGEELGAVKLWLSELKAKKATVDDSEERETTTAETVVNEDGSEVKF
jgi:hypothetical protein